MHWKSRFTWYQESTCEFVSILQHQSFTCIIVYIIQIANFLRFYFNYTPTHNFIIFPTIFTFKNSAKFIYYKLKNSFIFQIWWWQRWFFGLDRTETNDGSFRRPSNSSRTEGHDKGSWRGLRRPHFLSRGSLPLFWFDLSNCIALLTNKSTSRMSHTIHSYFYSFILITICFFILFLSLTMFKKNVI